MNNQKMDSVVKSFIKNKQIEEVFSDLSQKPLLNYPPEYRTKLLDYFCDKKDQVVCDSERGIDGGLYKGTVEIWNVEEYSPWEMLKPLTIVMGNLLFEEENERGCLIIKKGATLFVTGDLKVGNLEIHEGEIHCNGRLEIRSQLIISQKGYLSAREIIYKKANIQGVMKNNLAE